MKRGENVLDYLPHTSAHAVTARQLAIMTGLPERTITLQIETARRNGSPIVASCSGKVVGYYLTDDRNVLASYCRKLQHREREIGKTRRAMQKIDLNKE